MPAPTPVSQLEVINQVLTAVGENVLTSISSLSGTSKQATVMRTHYNRVVLYCHGLTAWRFATIKASLNKLSAAPLNRWAAAWNLPVDLVRLWTTWPTSNYEIQNRQVYTDETTRLEVDYTRLVEEAYWPGWFERLVVAELVMRCCKGLTGEDPSQDMKDERRAARVDALYQDSQQQPNLQVQSNDFTDVRN